MKLLLYSLFFVCTFGYSQNDTLPTSLKMYNFSVETSFKPFLWKPSFANNNYLTSYNSVTGLSNRYTKVGDTYFLSDTKTYSTLNIIDLSRTDSFNPNGTTDFGAAIIFGTLNLILKKN